MDPAAAGQTFPHATCASTELSNSNMIVESSAEPGPSTLQGTPSVPGMADQPGLGGAAPVAQVPVMGGRGALGLGWEQKATDEGIVPAEQWQSSPVSGSEGPLYESTPEQQRPSVAGLSLEVAHPCAHLLRTVEPIRAAALLAKPGLPVAAPFLQAAQLPPSHFEGWAGRGPVMAGQEEDAGLVHQEGSVSSRTSCYYLLPAPCSPQSAGVVLGSLAATPVAMSPGTFHKMSCVACCVFFSCCFGRSDAVFRARNVSSDI